MEFTKTWFAETAPQNAKSAAGTLTFTDVVVAADTVTIGDEVYEFVAAAGDIADPDNIPVVVGVTLTADNAVTKLEEKINAVSKIVTAVKSTTADTVVVTYKNVGTAGNAITISESTTNASWGHGHLEGGQFGTPCPVPYTYVKDDTYYYTNIAPNTVLDANWRRFQLAAY